MTPKEQEKKEEVKLCPFCKTYPVAGTFVRMDKETYSETGTPEELCAICAQDMENKCNSSQMVKRVGYAGKEKVKPKVELPKFD